MKKIAYVLGALSVLLPLNYVFAAAHSPGTNVISSGTIYMIANGQRRAYTSEGAFLSYGFNAWGTVLPASPEDMALPEGSFIPPRDGKIVCSDRSPDKGTCYLITNGKRSAFVSEAVFKKLGFSFGKTLKGDVSFLEKDSDIANDAEAHKPGVLINKNGTIYLVSSNGLMGIPSPEVLNTWGYSFADAVSANSSDSNQSQISVIANRQGAQLSPNQETAGSANESSLVQGYIDTHPDLPTAQINAPNDAASVIDLIQKIEAVPDYGFQSVYAYLSSQSIEMLNKAPNFKSYVETPAGFAVSMQITSTNVQVFQGGTTALFSEFKRQTGTGLIKNYYWVCQKENGVWKWDFIGTLKYQDKLSTQLNPNNTSTKGTGSNDIGITNAEYTSQPMVSDPNTLLLVEIKNNGQTTVENFHLVVRLNNSITIDEIENYELFPGQSMIVGVPIDLYWKIDGVSKSPGSYSTQINVSLDNNTTESNQTDNSFIFSTTFQQNNSTIKI
jgi:hypothetical protein